MRKDGESAWMLRVAVVGMQSVNGPIVAENVDWQNCLASELQDFAGDQNVSPYFG